MPKLKLTGRKLCTTGRKLAVCGCTPTYLCCQNSGNCRFAVPNTPFTFRTWANWTYSGAFNNGGASFSGSCEKAYSSADIAGSQADSAGPCRYAVVNTTAVNYVSTACAPITGQDPNRAGIVNHETSWSLPFSSPSGTPNLSNSPDWGVGGGSGGSQTTTFSVQFVFRVNGRDALNNSAQVSATFRVGAFNGVPFFEPDGAWTGTITPSFVLDGSCLVGIRADFNLTRETGFPLRTETTAGYAVAVVCNKLVGCNGTGIACGATPPGGGASLLDNLDDALFS